MTADTIMLDAKLLALLTGELGENQRIGKSCSEFGSIFSTFLPDLIESESQLKLKFHYDGCTSGLKDDLIEDLDEFMILVDGSLKNWCSDFTIACSSAVVVSMVECLLGGDADKIVEQVARPATAIELEVAPMITNKIASVLKSAVNAPGNYEPVLCKPYNADKRPKPAEDHVGVYAAQIQMKVEFGSLVSSFVVIIPQKTILKTDVKTPASGFSGSKTPAGWADQLQEQVRRSDVKVEARIRLVPLKLGTISRLQVGDVIPFLDHQDVRAQVSANGRDLYTCEFGRAGEQYTVRVKDTADSEDDLLRDIIG